MTFSFNFDDGFELDDLDWVNQEPLSRLPMQDGSQAINEGYNAFAGEAVDSALQRLGQYPDQPSSDAVPGQLQIYKARDGTIDPYLLTCGSGPQQAHDSMPQHESYRPQPNLGMLQRHFPEGMPAPSVQAQAQAQPEAGLATLDGSCPQFTTPDFQQPGLPMEVAVPVATPQAHAGNGAGAGARPKNRAPPRANRGAVQKRRAGTSTPVATASSTTQSIQRKSKDPRWLEQHEKYDKDKPLKNPKRPGMPRGYKQRIYETPCLVCRGRGKECKCEGGPKI